MRTQSDGNPAATQSDTLSERHYLPEHHTMKFKMKPTSRAVSRNMKADARRRVHLTPAQQALANAYTASKRPDAPIPMAAPIAQPAGPKDQAGWQAAWALKRAYAITLTNSVGDSHTVRISFKQPRTKDIVLTNDTFEQLDARAAW